MKAFAMSGKISLIFLYVILSLSSISSLETVNGKIKITVGTTAGCGWTVVFIQNHLVDVYAKYKDFLDLEFIPWGRTVWNADDTFTCQFNPNNCWANRLHRCVLNMLKGDEEAQLRYMACEFVSPSPSFHNGSYACAVQAGLRLLEVDHCVINPRDELDREAQRRGTEIMNVINGIPSLVLNDNIDLATHRQAISRLDSLICFALANDASTGITDCQF